MTNSTPDDVIWALTEASKPPLGLAPQAESTALFAGFLASRGYLHKSDINPTWAITRAGKAVLAGEASLTDADLEALTVFRRAV